MVREGGRILNVHALVTVGVNADGHREILGIDIASSEDGAGWLAFLRPLVAMTDHSASAVPSVPGCAGDGADAAAGEVDRQRFGDPRFLHGDPAQSAAAVDPVGER